MTSPNPNQNQNNEVNFQDDPFGGVKESVQSPAPKPTTVNFFHTKDDVDSKQVAHHHTLGAGHNQASPGDHKHDGITSKKLMDGTTITGAKAGNVALTNLIAALAPILGFTDSTT